MRFVKFKEIRFSGDEIVHEIWDTCSVDAEKVLAVRPSGDNSVIVFAGKNIRVVDSAEKTMEKLNPAEAKEEFKSWP